MYVKFELRFIMNIEFSKQLKSKWKKLTVCDNVYPIIFNLVWNISKTVALCTFVRQ